MTLGRLILAWLPVALWLGATQYVKIRVARGDRTTAPTLPPDLPLPPGAPPDLPKTIGRLADLGVVARAHFLTGVAEGLLLTLLASLWFDSLGHGGWWLLFLLLGLFRSINDVTFTGFIWGRLLPGQISDLAINLARYLVAGGILAWILN